MFCFFSKVLIQQRINTISFKKKKKEIRRKNKGKKGVSSNGKRKALHFQDPNVKKNKKRSKLREQLWEELGKKSMNSVKDKEADGKNPFPGALVSFPLCSARSEHPKRQ